MFARSLLWSSLLLVGALGACKGVDPVFVDAAPVDADTDVALGPATITVNRTYNEGNPGEPLEGAPVFFIRPDGTYEMKATGPDGKASAEVVAGSAILVARQRILAGAPSYTLTAFVGVEPGFDVIAGNKAQPPYTSAGQLTFTWGPVAGASYYRFASSCGSPFTSGTSVVLDVNSACPSATAATAVVTAFDQSGTLVGYSVDANVNLTASVGQTRTMPAFTTAPPSAATTYTNLSPATFESVDFDLELLQGDEPLASTGGYGTVTGQTLTLNGPIAPVGSSTWIKSRFSPTAQNLLDMFHVRRHGTQQLTHSLDVGANMLPMTTYPSFDPGSRTVAWTLSGGGTGRQADAVIARGYWYLGASGTFVDWTVVGPALTSHVTLPPLPTELTTLTPAASDEAYVNEFWMIDVVGKDGYQAVATDIIPESDGIFFYSRAFADEQELWFTGTLPL